MGVSGLLGHCLERREQCVDYVDLIEEARKRGGIEILVDYYGFQQTLLQCFWKSIGEVTRNPYICLLGGEYNSLEDYVKKLVTDLKSLDIHLVMFVDGAKGSSQIGTQQKIGVWKHRHHQDLKKLNNCVDVLNGRGQIESLSSSSNVRPVLLEVQIFETLKECHCDVVQCSSGEADFVIARNLQLRPRAFAVLSNDSDFCIFKDCRFIPNDLFDLQGDLQLASGELLPEKPIRLMVGTISSAKVVNMLGFQNQDQLVEMSIISGNDFTSQYVQPLKSSVGIKGSRISDVAGWIQKHRNIENHPVIRSQMDTQKAFAESVLRSRQFYTLTLPDISNEMSQSNLLWKLLDQGIQHGDYPASVMSMHQGFYWYRMLLEDCEYGQPCAESALADLRKFIYRIVLSPQDNVVNEYGRRPYDQFTCSRVIAVRDDHFLSIRNIQKDKIFQNLRTFHRVMSHYERGDQAEWYKRYGWKTGFIFYILRYFLVLNTGYNLHITMEEYMPLVAMVFCKVDEKWYQTLNIRPTTRCVTIGNWFQDVYRHAFLFLGKLLHLSHEFPHPKNIFCGSVWAGYYTTAVQEGQLRSARGFDHQSIQRIKRDMDTILKEKRHMIRYLLEGYYDSNTRF